MQIREIMTRDVEVVAPGDTIQRAAKLMDELNVGVLPVCEGPKLVGLVNDGKRAARPGYAVLKDGEKVGEISSGAPSPTLGHAIALAFVSPELTEPGTELDVDLRGKPTPFRVVKLPFYKRES